jgi:anti-sigma factor RsiW
MVCGLLLALSVTVSVAVRVPVAVGVKVREIVQWDFAARLPPQLSVSAKSPGLAPANVMLIGKAVVRLLPNSTFQGGLVFPTVCAAKTTEGVES